MVERMARAWMMTSRSLHLSLPYSIAFLPPTFVPASAGFLTLLTFSPLSALFAPLTLSFLSSCQVGKVFEQGIEMDGNMDNWLTSLYDLDMDVTTHAGRQYGIKASHPDTAYRRPPDSWDAFPFASPEAVMLPPPHGHMEANDGAVAGVTGPGGLNGVHGVGGVAGGAGSLSGGAAAMTSESTKGTTHASKGDDEDASGTDSNSAGDADADADAGGEGTDDPSASDVASANDAATGANGQVPESAGPQANQTDMHESHEATSESGSQDGTQEGGAEAGQWAQQQLQKLQQQQSALPGQMPNQNQKALDWKQFARNMLQGTGFRAMECWIHDSHQFRFVGWHTTKSEWSR